MDLVKSCFGTVSLMHGNEHGLGGVFGLRLFQV